jgi:uncharacterized protein (DUF983 family)
VSFPCPGCGALIDGRPDRFLLRCGGCGARLSGRSIETDDANPAFDVHVVGKPELRRRVEVAWDDVERSRLSTWLLVASLVTVALVIVLFVLARTL